MANKRLTGTAKVVRTEAFFVVQKRMKIGFGYRFPGEEVPEAQDWDSKVVKKLIDQGYLALVHGKEEQ